MIFLVVCVFKYFNMIRCSLFKGVKIMMYIVIIGNVFIYIVFKYLFKCWNLLIVSGVWLYCFGICCIGIKVCCYCYNIDWNGVYYLFGVYYFF